MNLELARKCRQERVKKRLSYRDFADMCNVTIEDIKEYEKGIKSIPTHVLMEYAKLKKGS